MAEKEEQVLELSKTSSASTAFVLSEPPVPAFGRGPAPARHRAVMAVWQQAVKSFERGRHQEAAEKFLAAAGEARVGAEDPHRGVFLAIRIAAYENATSAYWRRGRRRRGGLGSVSWSRPIRRLATF